MLDRYWGKIVSVIRDEGFWGGMKKIISAFFVIFAPVGSGDILFISSGVNGNSSRYRVRNIAEELGKRGFKCGFAVQEHPWLYSYADKFKIFIFHQANYTRQVASLVAEIKKQNKEIIFETDDLLFDQKYLRKQSFFEKSNALMRKFYAKNIGSEFVSDDYVKTCTTTTTFLAEKLREHNKKVFIVPNKLSMEDLKIAQASQKSKAKSQKSVRVGYFSGALSHNKDFGTITEVLMRIMEKYENVELVLAGPLDIENSLNKFSNRIRQLPYASREKHFQNIASVDINIAPLEIGNPFCEAKSELKFFEAGILEVPTVAAGTQTFREAIEDGVDGFVANNQNEWFEKLEKLILDENLRKVMGKKARKKAMEKYSVENSSNREYYAYLKKLITNNQ